VTLVFNLEYSGHARDMARELLVDKYDGIVIVSGDGLIHEVRWVKNSRPTKYI